MYLYHQSEVSLHAAVVLDQVFLSCEQLLLHEGVHVLFDLPHLLVDSHFVREEILYLLGDSHLIERSMPL